MSLESNKLKPDKQKKHPKQEHPIVETKIYFSYYNITLSTEKKNKLSGN